jgi:hypothetical protein
LCIPDVIKSISTSPSWQCCKLQERFFGQLEKFVFTLKNKLIFRQYLNKILKLSSFSNFVFQKFKFSKMIALSAFVNTGTKCIHFYDHSEKYILTPIFKQPEIWPVCNIARSGGMFLSLPIQDGWWLDRLPSRRHFKLIAATQCTF